jgi:hypothetical protein
MGAQPVELADAVDPNPSWGARRAKPLTRAARPSARSRFSIPSRRAAGCGASIALKRSRLGYD